MFYSPLEQFQIIFINNLFISNYIFNFIFIFLIIYFFFILGFNDYFFNTIKQIFIRIYIIIFKLLESNIKEFNVLFFPLIFFIFFLIFFCNLIGMLPYNFTITGQILTVFFFSSFIFISINFIGIYKFGLKFFKIFFPSNSDINLIILMLLIPIEFISYIFRLISLPVRLFSNIMAGHILIKIILGFLFSFFSFDIFISIVPIIFIITIIISLIFLEIGIAFIQAYVFIILLSVYLNDVLNLH